MKKSLTLITCLIFVALSFFLSPLSTAQRPARDEFTRRKSIARILKSKGTESQRQDDVSRQKAIAGLGKSEEFGTEFTPQFDAAAVAAVVRASKSKRDGKNLALEAVVRSETTARVFELLTARVQAEGSVRVIVGLHVESQQPGETPGEQQVLSAQQSNIAEAQEALLGRVRLLEHESVKKFEYIPFMALAVDAEGLAALRSSSEVVSIEEDVAVPPTLAESVPLIGAPAAWAAGFSGSGQTVAILDTGVDKTHPFLSGKVVSEACYSTSSASQNSNSVCPGGGSESTSSGSGVNCSGSVSGCDHGTHVAGIAAGRGSSFSGVAKDANVIAVQIFSRFNNASSCRSRPAPCVLTYTSDQIKGLERVYALRSTYNIAAVNMSLGGGQHSSNCDGESAAQKAAIDNLRSVGIATVIASGNDGYKDSIGSPACISTAISVGSTGDGSLGTIRDAVVDSSNSASFLHLLAPGKWINSSIPGGALSNFSGTSMATPHVAGAWAVLKSKSPSASVSQVYAALRDTGVLVTDVNGVTKPRIQVDAALNALGGSGVNPCTPTPLSVGQTVNGALSATDCRYPSGSARYSDTYTFSGTGGQQIAVSMSSSAFDTYLYLLGPSGNVVAENDDGGGGTNSRVPPSSGYFTLPSTGTYTIQATSFSPATAGSYTLNLTSQTPGGCSTPSPLSIGQTVSGALSTSDCRFTDGSYFDAYSFNGTAGQQVSVSMSSASFDTYLILLRPGGDSLAQDDDGGGGTNSRIPAGSGLLTLPATGTYTIYANSFAPSTTGGYTLTLNGQSLGGGCPPTSIALGQTVNGTLSTSDCRLSDGSFYDVYAFAGSAGQEISVSMSALFDTYLILLRPDGTVFAEDDDGGDGLNSRIPPESGILTLPTSGNYIILANSFSPNVTGGYTLRLTGTTPVSCPSSPLSIGQTVSGALSTSDCRFTDGSYFDTYSFNGTAGQQIVVSMSSLNFDTFLYLTGPNGLVVSDDDGGGGLNSRIPPDIGFFTLPSTGVHTIYANSFAPSTTGNYTLSLTQTASGCSYSILPVSRSLAPGASTGSVNVTTGGGCGWTAVSNASWISLTSGLSGTGSGTVNYSVTANNTSEARTGTISIAGHTFIITQDTASTSSSTVQFDGSSYVATEGVSSSIQITVTRSGNTSGAATVNYATSNGSATDTSDYLATLGKLKFASGETVKTFIVFITDDVLPESAETFNLSLSNPVDTTLGTQSTATVTLNSNDASLGLNPVKDPGFSSDFFVRQHYIDFFNREADAPGLAFWKNQIDSCGSNQGCREVRRINVSAAFFVSGEFQETGYLVYRFHQAAFNTGPQLSARAFLFDTQEIGRGVVVGQGNWQQILEQNKQAVADDFVARPQFIAQYPLTMSAQQYVAALNVNTAGSLSQAERDDLANRLSTGQLTRAQVLRLVAENQTFSNQHFNRAFVYMQYVGYLRRDPDTPGFLFWLQKMVNHGGNYISAEMVKAFITSSEYQERFGQ